MVKINTLISSKIVGENVKSDKNLLSNKYHHVMCGAKTITGEINTTQIDPNDT